MSGFLDIFKIVRVAVVEEWRFSMGKSNNIEKWKLCKICLWIIGAILLNTNTLFMQTVHASDESNGEYSYSVKEDGTIYFTNLKSNKNFADGSNNAKGAFSK